MRIASTIGAVIITTTMTTILMISAMSRLDRHVDRSLTGATSEDIQNQNSSILGQATTSNMNTDKNSEAEETRFNRDNILAINAISESLNNDRNEELYTSKHNHRPSPSDKSESGVLSLSVDDRPTTTMNANDNIELDRTAGNHVVDNILHRRQLLSSAYTEEYDDEEIQIREHLGAAYTPSFGDWPTENTESTYEGRRISPFENINTLHLNDSSSDDDKFIVKRSSDFPIDDVSHNQQISPARSSSVQSGVSQRSHSGGTIGQWDTEHVDEMQAGEHAPRQYHSEYIVNSNDDYMQADDPDVYLNGNEDVVMGGSHEDPGHDDLTRAENYPYNPSCQSCWNRDAKRASDLEQIRLSILRKLRMTSPPNVPATQILPQVPSIREIAESLQMQADAPRVQDTDEESYQPDDGGDVEYSTTEKYISFATCTESSDTSAADHVCQFRFQPRVSQLNVTRAVLGLYIRSLSMRQRGHVALHVYRLVPSRYRYASPDKELVRKWRLNLPTDAGRWLQLDLRPLSLVQQHQGVLNLLVEARAQRGDRLVVDVPLTEDEESYRPYIEVYVSELSTLRARRTLTGDNNCADGSAERRCCRYPLVVDFDSFDWNWVIAPRSYPAFYCAGRCPFLYHTTYTHTHLTQQTLAAGPCCSPRKLADLSMLYYDSNMNVVHSVLPGMIVDSCGCS